MAGDLEDFLRRAAERRQAKANQPPSLAKPPKRETPEYTDSRRERTIQRDELFEEPMVGEIIDEHLPSLTEERLAKQRAKVVEIQQKAAEAEAEAKRQRSKQSRPGDPVLPPAGPVTLTGDTRLDLVKLMHSPIGIRQAILLREILDRPTQRW